MTLICLGDREKYSLDCVDFICISPSVSARVCVCVCIVIITLYITVAGLTKVPWSASFTYLIAHTLRQVPKLPTINTNQRMAH